MRTTNLIEILNLIMLTIYNRLKTRELLVDDIFVYPVAATQCKSLTVNQEKILTCHWTTDI